jgi:hypothetical protein
MCISGCEMFAMVQAHLSSCRTGILLQLGARPTPLKAKIAILSASDGDGEVAGVVNDQRRTFTFNVLKPNIRNFFITCPDQRQAASCITHTSDSSEFVGLLTPGVTSVNYKIVRSSTRVPRGRNFAH